MPSWELGSYDAAVVATDRTPRAFLLDAKVSNTVYTVTRVKRQSREIVQWDFHCRRLQNGWLKFNASECFKVVSKLVEYLPDDHDGCLTILVSGPGTVVCHLQPLSLHPVGSKIAYLVDSVARRFPTRKYTDWLTERSAFERAGAQDMILTTNSGQLLEGFVTNVFILYKDGTLRTAKDSLVLNGSIRHLVIDQCCNISYQPIIWSDRHQWTGGFLTNAIRGVDVLETLQFGDTTFEFPRVVPDLIKQKIVLLRSN